MRSATDGRAFVNRSASFKALAVALGIDLTGDMFLSSFSEILSFKRKGVDFTEYPAHGVREVSARAMVSRELTNCKGRVIEKRIPGKRSC